MLACTEAPASLTVVQVFVVPGAGFAPGALFATVRNPLPNADTLASIQLAGAKSVMLHATTRDSTGRESMAMVQHLAIPPHDSVRLVPGNIHGMIEGLDRPAAGVMIAATFQFARAGAVRADARVIGFADVDSLLINRHR